MLLRLSGMVSPKGATPCRRVFFYLYFVCRRNRQGDKKTEAILLLKEWLPYDQSERSVLNSLLFDSCFLAGECTQVIQLSATYFTNLVDCDVLDERRLDREDTLYTYVLRHLTYCKTLLVAMTRDTDYNATILLDTLLVTLFDTISNRNRITTLE